VENFLLAVSAMIRQEGMTQPELDSRISEFRVILRNGASSQRTAPVGTTQKLLSFSASCGLEIREAA